MGGGEYGAVWGLTWGGGVGLEACTGGGADDGRCISRPEVGPACGLVGEGDVVRTWGDGGSGGDAADELPHDLVSKVVREGAHVVQHVPARPQPIIHCSRCPPSGHACEMEAPVSKGASVAVHFDGGSPLGLRQQQVPICNLGCDGT